MRHRQPLQRPQPPELGTYAPPATPAAPVTARLGHNPATSGPGGTRNCPTRAHPRLQASPAALVTAQVGHIPAPQRPLRHPYRPTRAHPRQQATPAPPGTAQLGHIPATSRCGGSPVSGSRAAPRPSHQAVVARQGHVVQNPDGESQLVPLHVLLEQLHPRLPVERGAHDRRVADRSDHERRRVGAGLQQQGVANAANGRGHQHPLAMIVIASAPPADRYHGAGPHGRWPPTTPCCAHRFLTSTTNPPPTVGGRRQRTAAAAGCSARSGPMMLEQAPCSVRWRRQVGSSTARFYRNRVGDADRADRHERRGSKNAHFLHDSGGTRCPSPRCARSRAR